MRTTAGAVNTDIGFFFFPLTLFLFSLSLLIHPAVVAAIAFSRVNDARGRADRFVFFLFLFFFPQAFLRLSLIRGASGTRRRGKSKRPDRGGIEEEKSIGITLERRFQCSMKRSIELNHVYSRAYVARGPDGLPSFPPRPHIFHSRGILEGCEAFIRDCNDNIEASCVRDISRSHTSPVDVIGDK